MMLLIPGAGPATTITVMHVKFTAPMAHESKTSAYLDRGRPYGDIFAVIGYTGGPFWRRRWLSRS